MKNLNWFAARNLARQGKAIRREAWRKWLTRSLALWWLDRKADGTAVRHVVQNTEFKSAEFLATDWTDEPWDETPAPSPTPPLPPPGGGGGGGVWGSPSNPPGGGSGYQPPPVDGPGGGPTGGTGGGGGDGGGSHHCPNGWHLSADGRKCEKDPGEDKTPTITVSIPAPDDGAFTDFDPSRQCFIGGEDGVRTIAELFVHVSIAGGPPGVGTLHVELQGHTQLGTGWPGMAQDFSFANIHYTVGSTLTATVQYTINGHTYTMTSTESTGTYTFPDWCTPEEGDRYSPDGESTWSPDGVGEYAPPS